MIKGLSVPKVEVQKTNERGAGRKRLPTDKKRVVVTCTLPPELVNKLPKPPSKVIEKALRAYFEAQERV